jgi:alkylation response protein AidB-like acyl-CoA dehydrogenase
MRVLPNVDTTSFREEVRSWLTDNVPLEDRPADGPELLEFDVAWQRRQFDAGWAGIDWPSDYGGRGLSLVEQVIWNEELCRSRAPEKSVLAAGLNQIGHTLMASASDEQKREHLAPILSGDVVWCQGFSEPDAGSDLASLTTRGIVDGDDLVVTGSKIWTTYGPYAEKQGLLLRTDADAPKHKGLSWVICDLRSPGIEIRSIRTIDGNAEFSEVFYDEVRIPVENVVGEINNGWAVALSTLAMERGPAFLDSKLAMIRVVEDLIELAKHRDLLTNEPFAERLARARAATLAVRSLAYLSISSGEPEHVPATMGSAVAVFQNELRQEIARLAVDVLGQSALEAGPWTERWTNSFCATIAGGTSEIQRNITGERALGLPR